MKIECHVLQNFAPSCLNRDDNNSPKDCEFGGVRRARVSSQSWKRAMREFFRADNSAPVAIRTKKLHEELTKELEADIAAPLITKFLETYYAKMDKKRPEETSVLVFLSKAEIALAAQLIRTDQANLAKEKYAVNKEIASRLKAAQGSVDLALFGRMLAEQPDRNIDAACQVAHAISTHQVDMEMDFYTAVDDITERNDEIGAGMLGTQGFNSACFYRYALIDYHLLLSNLGNDAKASGDAVQAFLEAFSLAIPRAKQNSHAAQNLPSLAMFIARDKGAPVSLANAFARPIRSEDLIGASVHAFSQYFTRMDAVYGLYKDATIALFHDRDTNKPLDLVAQHDKASLTEAVATIMERVRA